ncbi:MAG: hypothetical protein FWC55_02740, partial [Firmicutes bacterium]|nr:hypothetical protein [Bacillota bacterium]
LSRNNMHIFLKRRTLLRRFKKIFDQFISGQFLTGWRMKIVIYLSHQSGISLADSIALAEAAVIGGHLITADHHELDIVERNESVRFFWIR